MVIALFALCLAGAGAFVLGREKSRLEGSWPYQAGLKAAVADSRVTAALGAPVRAGFVVRGSLDEKDPHRTVAELAIPLAGTAQNGTLKVTASTDATGWTMQRCVVELGDGRMLEVR